MKLGDKVFVCGDSSFVGSEFNGKTGEITNVDKFDSEAEYEVSAVGIEGHLTNFWHPASSLLLVDADGWIENTGVQPVAGGVVVDIKCGADDQDTNEAQAYAWNRGLGITHWRFHQGEKEKSPEPPRVMRLSEQVALLEDFKASLTAENTALQLEVASLKSKLEAIRGIV